jgi:hypothetical protein
MEVGFRSKDRQKPARNPCFIPASLAPPTIADMLPASANSRLAIGKIFQSGANLRRIAAFSFFKGRPR